MSTLNWTHEMRELAGRALDAAREAEPAERAAIAAQLDLLSCESFKVQYRLRRLDQGRAALSGHLEADITQSCVVTLEPVVSRLGGAFDLELWPASELPAVGDGTIDPLADDEPEAIENGTVDVGRIVLERLADLIDPYPRKPGAVASWADEKAPASRSQSPFAKLKNFGGRS